MELSLTFNSNECNLKVLTHYNSEAQSITKCPDHYIIDREQMLLEDLVNAEMLFSFIKYTE